MSITLKLEPAVEGSLKRIAAERGETPDTMAELIIIDALLAMQRNHERFAKAQRDFDLKRLRG